jgi:peptidoglycan/LPS O-acetylase OafA/YrhL
MNKRFEALDAFRGLCALSVVVLHMNLIGSVTELDFFKGSWIFVEFFFVLSGFVLAHGYGFKEDLNFKSFMKSRFFRLYPLHFFMFIFFLSLQLIKLLAYKFGMSFDTEPFTDQNAVSEIIPNLLLLQSWTPFTNHSSFNSPSWSISIEFYMYALLFLTIVSFKKHTVSSWFFLSLIAFILIYAESTILVRQVLRGLSCFFGGAVTYIVYKKISHLKLNYILGSLSEITLIALVIFIVQSDIEYRSVVGPMIFFVTVLTFSYESGIASQVLKVKFFQYFGKLSYSIYMVHVGVLSCLGIFTIVLEKYFDIESRVNIEDVVHFTFGNSITNNLAVLIIVAIVIFISSLTYKYIELPGQRLNKKI